MTVVTQHPWQNGPKELIEYALQHLHKETDFDQRIAFLLLDVGVETLFKTFLTLPDGVTGAQTSFHKRNEASKGSFHELVSGVEAAAPSRLQGCNLHHVQFYHDLRNKLYHQGNGITVPTKNAKGYAELAVRLLKALLDVDLTEVLQKPELEKAIKQQVDEVRNALDHIRLDMKQIMETIEPLAVMPWIIRQFQYVMAADDDDDNRAELWEYFCSMVENHFDYPCQTEFLTIADKFVWYGMPDSFPLFQLFQDVLLYDMTPLYLMLFETETLDLQYGTLSSGYVDAEAYVQSVRNDDAQAIERGQELTERLAEVQAVIKDWLKAS